MKYIVKLLFFVLSFFSLNISIFALEPSVEYIENVYSNRISDDLIYSGQLGYILVDGKFSFCLSPYQIIGKSYIVDNSYMDKISKEDLDYIKLVSNYTKINVEHKNAHYYMAAQELIWERLFGKNKFFWSTEINDGGSRIDVSFIKEEIENYIKDFNTKPSFDGTFARDSFYSTIILTDNNNVLWNYEIADEDKDIAWISGNQLFIQVKSSKVEEVKLTRKISDGDAIYYRSDTNQDLAYLSSHVEISSKVSVQANEDYYVNLFVNMIDDISKKNINGGISFRIINEKDNTALGEYTTYNGSYYINQKFTSGKYRIELLDVPRNYVIESPLEFEISEDASDLYGNNIVNFEISKASGVIKINNFSKEEKKISIHAASNIYNQFNNIVFKKNDLIDETKILSGDTYETMYLPFGDYYIVTDEKNFLTLEYIDAFSKVVYYEFDIKDKILPGNIEENKDIIDKNLEDKNNIVDDLKQDDNIDRELENKIPHDDLEKNKENNDIKQENSNNKLEDKILPDDIGKNIDFKTDEKQNKKEEKFTENLNIKDLLPNTFDFLTIIKIFIVLGIFILFKHES